VTDRPTDYATRSVTMCHIYVRSTAIRRNNNYSYVFSLVLGIEIVFFRALTDGRTPSDL